MANKFNNNSTACHYISHMQPARRFVHFLMVSFVHDLSEAIHLHAS